MKINIVEMKGEISATPNPNMLKDWFTECQKNDGEWV